MRGQGAPARPGAGAEHGEEAGALRRGGTLRAWGSSPLHHAGMAAAARPQGAPNRRRAYAGTRVPPPLLGKSAPCVEVRRRESPDSGSWLLRPSRTLTGPVAVGGVAPPTQWRYRAGFPPASSFRRRLSDGSMAEPAVVPPHPPLCARPQTGTPGRAAHPAEQGHDAVGTSVPRRRERRRSAGLGQPGGSSLPGMVRSTAYPVRIGPEPRCGGRARPVPQSARGHRRRIRAPHGRRPGGRFSGAGRRVGKGIAVRSYRSVETTVREMQCRWYRRKPLCFWCLRDGLFFTLPVRVMCLTLTP